MLELLLKRLNFSTAELFLLIKKPAQVLCLATGFNVAFVHVRHCPQRSEYIYALSKRIQKDC